MLNRVSRKAGLAVIYIAPRNLDQIGACASTSRHLKTIPPMIDRCNIFQKSAYIYKYFIKVVFNNIDCTFKRTEMRFLGLNLATTTIFFLKLIC